MRRLAFVVFAGIAFGEGEQQFAEIGDLKLVGGSVLRNCKLGYRTYGQLNAGKSNAILIPTWFSGRTENLAQFVGTGKIADSSKFFVVTVDALGNGISTSPSNGQKPFPNITIKDMVNSQHELLTRKLGIGHVHAVMGISMGGMQTFEWMVAYPGFMTHAVPIIGSPKLASPDLLLWQAQLSAIESAKDSREGMKAVMAMHNYALQTPEWRAQNTPSADWAKFKTQFEGDAGQRMTPEDWASQLRAMMSTDVTAAHGGSWDAAARAVHADALVVVATQDHMVNPGPALEFARLLGAAVVKLEGNCGHMATGCEAEKFETAVRIFLGQR